MKNEIKIDNLISIFPHVFYVMRKNDVEIELRTMKIQNYPYRTLDELTKYSDDLRNYLTSAPVDLFFLPLNKDRSTKLPDWFIFIYNEWYSIIKQWSGYNNRNGNIELEGSVWDHATPQDIFMEFVKKRYKDIIECFNGQGEALERESPETCTDTFEDFF